MRHHHMHDEALRKELAQALARSKCVPIDYQNNPKKCLSAILKSHELGITPLQVMRKLCAASLTISGEELC